MVIKRRDLLKLSLLGAGAQLLQPLWGINAWALPASEKHLFVLIGVAGTMDVTLGLDPLTHAEGQTTQSDIYIEYSPSQILRKGQMLFGPAAAALAPYANDIAVINGIHMRQDIGHVLDYIASGSGDRLTADLATEMSSQLYTGKKGVMANMDLLSGSRFTTATQPSALVADQVSGDDQLFWNTQQSLSLTQDNNTPSQYLTVDEFNAFKKAVSDLGAQGFDTTNDMTITAAAMATGLSYQAFLQPQFDSNNVDTHVNHPGVHIKEQTKIWKQVAALFKLYKAIPYQGGSLFDSTTFMVCTDMSRTPFLNKQNGKDHNFETNSVLLAGRGIQGGLTIGHARLLKQNADRSEALHTGYPIDFTTCEMVKALRSDMTGVNKVYPENVVRTVMELFDAYKLYPEKRMNKLPFLSKVLKS